MAIITANGIGVGWGGKSIPSTSYTNPLSIGDRTSTITVTSANISWIGSGFPVTNLVNGTIVGDLLYLSGAALAGNEYIRFDLGSAKLITEAKWYQDQATAMGTWKWQGSQNASSWTDIGSSFTLGGATVQTQTALNGNTTQYRYYQLIGVSGSSSSTPYTREIEFKISA
jgi:hypothetical protein